MKTETEKKTKKQWAILKDISNVKNILNSIFHQLAIEIMQFHKLHSISLEMNFTKNYTNENYTNASVPDTVTSLISLDYFLWQKIIIGFFMAIIIVSSIIGKFDRGQLILNSIFNILNIFWKSHEFID